MKKYLHNQSLKLESGGELQKVEIAYHTIGNLNPSRSNVVWVFHALTANSYAADWWKGLVGENSLINPEEYFIVCANILGSTYGTTGPLSKIPGTNRSYFHDFPLITIRDMVNVHDLLREHLGIRKIYLGLGGSMGGQQLLEWSVSNPSLFENICLVATNPQHSPWGIAFNETQRMAIENDPTWRKGGEDAGLSGLQTARAIALLSYRHYDAYMISQSEESNESLENYKASRYQRHQGKKLSDRFNAYSYVVLSRAMDSHHIGRNRGGVSMALNAITARTLVIGIENDLLFPSSEQHVLANGIRNAELAFIQSSYGHDGFLVETKMLSEIIGNFLEKKKECIFLTAESHRVTQSFTKPIQKTL